MAWTAPRVAAGDASPRHKILMIAGYTMECVDTLYPFFHLQADYQMVIAKPSSGVTALQSGPDADHAALFVKNKPMVVVCHGVEFMVAAGTPKGRMVTTVAKLQMLAPAET